MKTIDTYKHQKMLRCERQLSSLITDIKESDKQTIDMLRNELNEVKNLFKHYKDLKEELTRCIYSYHYKYQQMEVVMYQELRKLSKNNEK